MSNGYWKWYILSDIIKLFSNKKYYIHVKQTKYSSYIQLHPKSFPNYARKYYTLEPKEQIFFFLNVLENKGTACWRLPSPRVHMKNSSILKTHLPKDNHHLNSVYKWSKEVKLSLDFLGGQTHTETLILPVWSMYAFVIKENGLIPIH